MSGRVSAAADRCLVRPPSARELLFSTGRKANAAPSVPVPVAPPPARSRPVGMLRRVRAAADRRLQLERFIADRAQSGSLASHDALKLFDLLLPHARPASVTAFNHLLTAVSRASGRHSTLESQLGISLFDRMVRECSDKVAPDRCTYSILIGCFCRMGRLEHGFAVFGLILKTGWRVNHIVFNQLLKGLCDAKRLDEATNILLWRMPEFGCTPNVVSYNTLVKGFCNENRAEEALELLHVMADDQGLSCPPDVVSYNTVINGFFREGQVDKAYNLFLQMIDRGDSTGCCDIQHSN